MGGVSKLGTGGGMEVLWAWMPGEGTQDEWVCVRSVGVFENA